MQVGIIGIGRMGLAMAKRLAGRGFEVVGWDIDPARGHALAGVGATVCPAASDVVQRSEIVLSIVTDDAAVHSLFEGKHGLLSGPASGRLFIEMSTVQPETSRRAGALAAAAGAGFIAAPVLGSVPTVDEGKLLVLASGKAEDIERSKAVLTHLAREVVNLGDLGASNAMKLIVNLTMAAYLEALSEGLALGVEEGLSMEQMLAVLASAPTANPWLASKREILLGAPAATTLDLGTLQKDVLDAVAAGSLNGVAMPMAAGILSALTAARATGFGGEDLAQLPRFFRQHMVRR